MNEKLVHFSAEEATVKESGREDRVIALPPEECPHPAASQVLRPPESNLTYKGIPWTWTDPKEVVCRLCGAVIR